MTSGRIQVREKATGQVIEVWPVDAGELLRSGEYEPADAPAAQVAAGKPAFPMTGKVRPTLEKPAPPVSTGSAAPEAPASTESAGGPAVAEEADAGEGPAKKRRSASAKKS